MGSRARPAADSRGLSVCADLVIRRATEEDLDEIVRIERESFPDPWSKSDFRSVMAAERAIFLVAAETAETAASGYVVMLPVLDEAEVLNIAVDRERRRKSIGESLLDAALAAAETQGVKSTFLEVRESNEAARRLYDSRGFEVVSRRRRYYRSPVEDALVLRRAAQR